MSKQQTLKIRQYEPTKNLVERLPVKEVSKSFQNQEDISRAFSATDLIGLSWVLFEEE